MASTTIDERLIPSVQYVTPTTGATVAVNNNGHVRLLINPAGTLLALTVNLPSGPSDGDIVELASSQIVTTLTMGNGTILGALTTLAVGGFGGYVYSSTAGKWFRRL